MTRDQLYRLVDDFGGEIVSVTLTDAGADQLIAACENLHQLAREPEEWEKDPNAIGKFEGIRFLRAGQRT